jgi:hypothetical protein
MRMGGEPANEEYVSLARDPIGAFPGKPDGGCQKTSIEGQMSPLSGPSFYGGCALKPISLYGGLLVDFPARETRKERVLRLNP